jgi:hypothetical protein
MPPSIDMAPLARIERLARENAHNWRPQFETYLEAMYSAQQFNATTKDYLLSKMDEIPVQGPSGTALLFAVLWTITSCVATVAWIAGPREKWIVIGGTVLTFFLGVAWAYFNISLPRSTRKNPKRILERRAFLALSGFVAPVIVTVATGIATLSSFALAQADFSKQRERFEADPSGFQMIRAFAMRNFKTVLVLGNPHDGWTSTMQMLPGASSASIKVLSGHCELNADPRLVLSAFNQEGQKQKAVWVQGILIHELGHCLDVSRDFPAFGHPWGENLSSIAPSDRLHVTSVAKLADDFHRPATALWREALSDVMAVGYWRLVDEAAAKNMIESLDTKRLEASKDDRSHATSCWIRQARTESLPSSQAALFDWADKIRASSTCNASQ